jgi:hypothetical protein
MRGTRSLSDLYPCDPPHGILVFVTDFRIFTSELLACSGMGLGGVAWVHSGNDTPIPRFAYRIPFCFGALP